LLSGGRRTVYWRLEERQRQGCSIKQAHAPMLVLPKLAARRHGPLKHRNAFGDSFSNLLLRREPFSGEPRSYGFARIGNYLHALRLRKKRYSLVDPPDAHRFQSFTTLALANMLSELRKYRVGFTVAHQYLHQLEPDVRHAVLGNAGTIISFRVGAEDAPYLAREFQPRFEEIDLLQLPNHHVYLKLMIDGMPSKPFSAVTLKP
jgi:hypothetical protein